MEIQELILEKIFLVFLQIPQNSIRIPVAGNKTYSPDFAYVVEYENGNKKLNFVVESKNTKTNDYLRDFEKQKMKHAERLFDDNIKIHFKEQFKNDDINNIIEEIIQKEN